MKDFKLRVRETCHRANAPRLAASSSVLVVLAAFAIFYQPVVVQGKSMLPALRDGQVVLMDRQYYRWNDVRKDDIVIFHHGRDLYVKRVYATEGKTVRMLRSSDGTASLLESMGPPSRIAQIVQNCPHLGSIVAVHVPARCVFVVGDNVNSSLDSRDFGPIPANEIMGYIPEPKPVTTETASFAPVPLRMAQR